MKNIFIKIFKLRRIEKKIIVYLLDLIISLLSLLLTLLLLNIEIELNLKNIFLFSILSISFTLFYIPFDIYKSISRFFGLTSLLRLFFVNVLYLTYCLGFNLLFFSNIIEWLFSFYFVFLFNFFTSFVRLSFVFLINYFNTNPINSAMIYGAGFSGVKAKNFLKNYNIVAFIDDDASKVGNKIENVPILDFESVINISKYKKVRNLFICINNINLSERKKIIKKVSSFNFIIKFLEPYDSQNKYFTNLNFRKLEFNELIDRDISWNDKEIFNVINNKSILITGAAGSIGSELTKQIVRFSPKKIILLDNSEYNLYNLSQKAFLDDTNLESKNYFFKLNSINNEEDIENILKTFKPDLIFHTAAFKHVHLVEENPIVGLKNNFLSTVKLVELSIKYKVNKFIYISTDKAVRPSSIMGLSKRLSELYIQLLKREGRINNNQDFIIVRFGNVFGSNGSVVPLFTQQIENGGPITVTHQDVKRYFMSIYEAVGLILECSTFKKTKDIFLLEMGQQIKIIDLARKLISLSGLTEKTNKNPNGDIEIKIIGLRAGEKIEEELVYNDSKVISTNKNVYFSKEEISEKLFSDKLLQLTKEAILKKDIEKIRNLLN